MSGGFFSWEKFRHLLRMGPKVRNVEAMKFHMNVSPIVLTFKIFGFFFYLLKNVCLRRVRIRFFGDQLVTIKGHPHRVVCCSVVVVVVVAMRYPFLALPAPPESRFYAVFPSPLFSTCVGICNGKSTEPRRSSLTHSTRLGEPRRPTAHNISVERGGMANLPRRIPLA